MYNIIVKFTNVCFCDAWDKGESRRGTSERESPDIVSERITRVRPRSNTRKETDSEKERVREIYIQKEKYEEKRAARCRQADTRTYSYTERHEDKVRLGREHKEIR